MMCSAAASQATTWMAIQTKLELVKELHKANLISPAQYKFNLEKLAEEVGIETMRFLKRELDKAEKIPFEKKHFKRSSFDG